MKILLLGKNGQVGWELQRALAPLGELIALDRHGSDGLCGDLERLDALADSVQRLAPDLVVNAAAYTAVDQAENDAERAHRINADAVGVLARQAAALGALLVHYSTDYVFDGSGERPWRENDLPSPLSVYGASKLAGEDAIRTSGCDHLIFRTSWVHAARGGNFARTMLRLAAERERLTVIDDQIGAPTGADLIADVSAHAIRRTMSDRGYGGTYHLAAGGQTSWRGYASFVIDRARSGGRTLAVREIVPIPASSYPTPATRPLNSRLDTRRLRERFDLHLADWRDGVARMLDELG
ncbi:dTDP-4-dehydrorhamnose reductase [Thauera sp. Sel9]|uniref:dTDP-4-dehydrorhamnose reductase n=1 Tax=Thauera sp. Sel9 TaxID=2974299 RepID=UPI0021E13478|nr:dTDP-4-dehydrorhamnose reductase [Thauera sp. Sel9]MCV2216213.1 dTDP-4-dehydrorhamnose reductase [Thauera sp. Sel9]